MKNESRKKYELLKTSWTFQTQEYFDNSTLHGVRYINEEGRPFCEKFMWFCFTSVGGLVTLIIIVSLWEKFQTNPTITGLDTDFHNWNVPFPTISICPDDPVNHTAVEEYIKNNNNWKSTEGEALDYYKRFLGQVGKISLFNLQNFSEFDGDDSQRPLQVDDYKSVLEQVVKKCEYFISDCIFKAEKIKCCDKVKPLLTEVGYCYSFNSMYRFTGKMKKDTADEHFHLEHIHETDQKWNLIMKVNSSNENGENVTMRIYLHSAHDFPVVDVSPQHIWDQRIQNIFFASKQTYTTEGARQLSIRQRKCVFEDEIKLLTSEIYTYSLCMIQCRMILARELCECVPFFYHETDGFKYCDLKGLKCLGDHQDELLHVKNCPCELGCSNTVYEVEKLMAVVTDHPDSLLDIGFVSWPMVRYKREVLFGWVDLLVSFGGIAGLFLGFSLLSGVEIIYYFTMRAICMVYQDKEDLKKLQEEYEKAEKPPLDLRLTPTFMRKIKGNARNNVNPITPSRVEPVISTITRTLPTGITNIQPANRNNNIGLQYNKPVYSKFEFLP